MNEDFLFTDVGIDSIGFYAPRYYIDLQELALERGVKPDKLTKGLLLSEMRMPDYDEDIISFALKAGYNALYRGNIKPKDIDAVFVGTETMTYSVKSVSNILVELLGISKYSMTQDIYNACAAQTLAILNAIALIEKGIINKALVVGADISYYNLDTPSELTQGSGAVALIISKEPRIANFEKRFGKVSSNINDFFRPANEENAQVFGSYSVNSYLNFQIDAYDNLISQIGDFYANYYVFHAPYAKLPIKCMQELIVKRMLNNTHINLDLKQKHIKDSIIKEIDSFLHKLSINQALFYTNSKEKGEINELMDKITNWVESHFKERVLPQLEVPKYFGNMYSASVWAQINFILENYANSNEIIYFGSYGSGATCISGLLKVNPTFKSIVQREPNIHYYIDNKIKRSVEEYELMRQGLAKPKLVFGRIIEHEKNNGRGFTLHFCDKGCQIPAFKGLDYCPKGHQGFHEKFFPLYAVLESYPITTLKPHFEIYRDGFIRITPNSKKGDIMEYEIRRIDIKEEKGCEVEGLLNWIPTYSPTKRVI